MSTHQWNGRESSRGRGVRSTTLYGDVAEHRRAAARATSRTAMAAARTSPSAALVESLAAVRQRAAQRRTEWSTRAGTTSRCRLRSPGTPNSARLRRSHRRPGRGRAAAKRSRTRSTSGGTKSSATSCAWGCSIDAPAPWPWLMKAARARCPCVEVERGAVAQHEEHLDRGIVVEVGEASWSCAGDEHDHLVRAGTPSPTIGYLFGTTRTLPRRRIGCAGAGARDFGRCVIARCRRRTGRRERSAATEDRRCGTCPAGSHDRARRSRASRSRGLRGVRTPSGRQATRWPAHTLGLVPVRFVIIGGGPAGNTAATVAASHRCRGHAHRTRRRRRRRAPLGLHPEQGDGRDGERAHRARPRPTRWDSTRTASSTSPRCASASPASRTTLREGVDEPPRVAGCAHDPRHRPPGRSPYTVAAVTDEGVEEIEADAILLSTGLATADPGLGDARRRTHPRQPPGLPAARDPRAPRRHRFGCHRCRVHAHVQRARLRR